MSKRLKIHGKKAVEASSSEGMGRKKATVSDLNVIIISIPAIFHHVVLERNSESWSIAVFCRDRWDGRMWMHLHCVINWFILCLISYVKKNLRYCWSGIYNNHTHLWYRMLLIQNTISYVTHHNGMHAISLYDVVYLYSPTFAYIGQSNKLEASAQSVATWFSRFGDWNLKSQTSHENGE